MFSVTVKFSFLIFNGMIQNHKYCNLLADAVLYTVLFPLCIKYASHKLCPEIFSMWHLITY